MAYSHLNINERQLIAKLHAQGRSAREIGQVIDRHHTTVSRELKRYAELYTNQYNPNISNNIALYWRITPRHAKRRMYKPLYRHVIKQLKQGDSPDIIAGRLTITDPDNPRMRISHETIYRWIYADALHGGTLYKHLNRQRRFRRKNRLWSQKGFTLKDRVSIHDRPQLIDERSRLGDWEGDLVEGKRSTGYFLTLTERVSRFIIASKLNTKESNVVSAHTIRKMRRLKHHVHSITFDNGKEFYNFKKTEKSLDTEVFFADPYSSWQRGTNEHANGMLRRYFPKGTDFRTVSGRHLKAVVDKINNRPRKILNYRTPAEVFNQLSGALGM